MVLIFSKNDDYSTSSVVKWLIKNKIKFLRLNENDEILIKKLTSNHFIFEYLGNEYSLDDFKSVWYRRGDIMIKSFDNNIEYLKLENNAIIKNIYFLLNKKKHINTFFSADFNKLELLNFVGFNLIKIPKSIVTQNKNDAVLFFDSLNKKVISKPVSIPFSIVNEKGTYMSYTSKIDERDIKSLPDFFVPTLFQEEIEKRFEIRTFVLDNKTYSMCIFSQNNNQTKIDFRVYDEEKPNRLSPFNLPPEIEKDIFKILNHYDIDCASLDLIYTSKKEFYILDINPIGQFGMVSLPCNYNLEKNIANYLSL